MNTYTIPAQDVRPGDTIKFSPTAFRQVVESREYMGTPGRFDGFWVLTTLLPDSTNPQLDEDGNEFWPDECTDPHTVQPDAPTEIMVSDSALLHPETLLPIRWWVAVYEIDRGFGGPEEGGWWFDTGDLRASVPCRSRDEADAVAARLSETWTSTGRSGSMAYNGGDYGVWVEKDQPAEFFPERQPHYS